MHKFLYIFCYKTPEQMATSDPDESSEAFFIEASSADEALEWGREISERFIARLFGNTGTSWKTMGFPHWVESEPFQEYPEETLAQVPMVPCGSFPA